MLILGIADLISALILVRGFYGVSLPEIVIFFFTAYLVIKGIIFIADIGSIMDIVTGALLVLSVFYTVPQPLLLVFAILIGIKGALSMLGGIR